MSERAIPQPASANLAQAPKEFSYADKVADLLAVNYAAQGHNEESAGRIIMDKYVGALFAHNGASGSKGRSGPKEISEAMSTLPDSLKDGVKKENAKDDATYDFFNKFTRSDGLRDSVLLLLNDPRTAKLFGTVSKDVATDNATKKPVMTNTTQLEGYLETLASDNGAEHQDWGKLTTPIWIHAIKTPDEYIRSRSPFQRRDAGFSSLFPHEKQMQADFNMALATAEAMGANEQLLQASVRKIEEIQQDKWKISETSGHVALGGVGVIEPIPTTHVAEVAEPIKSSLLAELKERGVEATSSQVYLGAEISSQVDNNGVRETLQGLIIDDARMIAVIAMSREGGNLEGYTLVEVGKPGETPGKLLDYVVLGDMQKPVSNNVVGEAIQPEKVFDITMDEKLAGQLIVSAEGNAKYVNKRAGGSMVLTGKSVKAFGNPDLSNIISNKDSWLSTAAFRAGNA